MMIIRIAFAAAALAVVLPAPAGADPAILIETVSVGGPCDPRNVNSTASAPNGTPVRCIAAGAVPGFTWETESAGVRQIGRLQDQGLTVNVIRTGAGQLSCAVTSATAAEGTAVNTVNVTLACP